MASEAPEATTFGWSELIAAALAVGLAVFAMPSPASSAPMTPGSDDEDWNFLWVKPTAQPSSDEGLPIDVAGSVNLALEPLTGDVLSSSATGFGAEESVHTDFSHRIDFVPIGARTAPAVAGGQSFQPGVTLREDQWTMVDVDGVLRLTAYARGPVEHEDMNQLRTSTSFPRALGTGIGVVTATPVYVGATVKTDRSIYDIDPNRFDGARWSTSVFMGTDTSLGPVYVGASQDAQGTRGAYLYLGRWF